MSSNRASKGFLVDPESDPNIPEMERTRWMDSASAGFVSPSESNRGYYRAILEALWPSDHGIPGPIISQTEIREAVDQYRAQLGKPPYKDVFRRLRELQGDEGFTAIIKEGVNYQLQSLTIGSKREPRAKWSASVWRKIKDSSNFRCNHCGEQEPSIVLSPDHRVPRARQGSNGESNWQPLCEQCNIMKSSACRGCTLNCFTCSWSYPEKYRPIKIDDNNEAQLRRTAKREGLSPSAFLNKILRAFFNKKGK